jgi:hypothetical protein
MPEIITDYSEKTPSFVFCHTVLPLPPGENPFAVKINHNNKMKTGEEYNHEQKYCDMLTRCYVTTARKANIQQPLLSKSLENKHVSTAII